MPSLKASTIFLFCLSYQAPEKARLWDCPQALALYKIDHAPSADEKVTVLDGLTRDSMRLLAAFIVAIEKKSIDDRAAFIDRKSKDDEWVQHRGIWMRWYRKFSPKVNFLLDQSLRDNDSLPHQQMRGMMMQKFPAADTCSRYLDELAVALFTDEILSGDQVVSEITSVLKPLISIALSTRWQKKYKIALHHLTGEALKTHKKGAKVKVGINHLELLDEALLKLEAEEVDLVDARNALNIIKKVKPYIMWMPHKEVLHEFDEYCNRDGLM